MKKPKPRNKQRQIRATRRKAQVARWWWATPVRWWLRLRRRPTTALWRRWAGAVTALIVLAGAGWGLALTWPQIPGTSLADNGTRGIHADYTALVREANDLESRQHQAGVEVAAAPEIEQLLSRVRTNIDMRQMRQARADMRSARTTIAGWRAALSRQTAGMAGWQQGRQLAGSVLLPILMYHYTPPNFEEQLAHLERTGYTVVSLDQAVAGLSGGPLPAKPVVITFDDGFADQMSAFAILQRHRMKATFYIINGSETSQWCIGSGRRYNDPLQPPGGCGDAYLSWDQVRLLDKSGLITIGGHTIDHENLTLLDAEGQHHQIADSKTAIEQQIGHPIKHLAYPVGAYNQTSIDTARAAGYISAVTTNPGLYQAPGMEFVLQRERDAFALP